MVNLTEEKRSELLNKSKHADNYAPQNQMYGKNRYERRLRSRVSSSVKEYNQLDMNELFKNNILTVNVPVNGETDNYLVTIKMEGILNNIHNQLQPDSKIDLRIITRALINTFNSDNVFIHCSCPDWNYRFSYWSRVNDISADPNIEQTNNGRYIVNPDDTKGRGCKHSLLVLSNNRWLRQVASVIYNYINYMEKHYQKLYADIIYPAIYEKEYEDDVQLSFDDIENDNLIDDSEQIDISNKEAKTRGQFKPGNQSGVQFTAKNDGVNNNQQFDFDSLIDES